MARDTHNLHVTNLPKLLTGDEVMRAIGVPEIAGYLRGDWSLEEARERGRIATRQYAKRQYTWFRHQPPPEWPRIDDKNYTAMAIFEILLQHLPLT